MDETADGHSLLRRELSQLDLNALVQLDALLRERGVTAAARQLHLSQPAMSAALARLRAHFDDALLVRNGRTHELSSLGRRLVDPVTRVLDTAHEVFTMSPGFDPALEEREFVIHCSDHSATVAGTVVRRLAAQAAPGVTLRFVHRELAEGESPGALLARADGALLPEGVLRESPHIDVFHDRWACIVSRHNTRVGDRLSRQDLADLPWVATHHRAAADIAIAPRLTELGIRPRIASVVDGFLSLPYFVAGTDSIAVVQKRLVDRLPASLGLRTVEPPFTIDPHKVGFWWHRRHDSDPAHEWLRQLFAKASGEISAL